MQIYILHTNEGDRYVKSTDKALREAMSRYIKAKRDKGIPLSTIVFCWAPVRVSSIPTGE